MVVVVDVVDVDPVRWADDTVTLGWADADATIVIAITEPAMTTTSEPTRCPMVADDGRPRPVDGVWSADEPLKMCPCVFMTSIFDNQNHLAPYVIATMSHHPQSRSPSSSGTTSAE